MGWSCSQLAGETLDKWYDFCRKSTNSTNNYWYKGKQYFIETSYKEHDDGAITGSIFVHLPDNKCKTSSTFRINGDGTIERAPKILKDITKNVKMELTNVK